MPMNVSPGPQDTEMKCSRTQFLSHGTVGILDQRILGGVIAFDGVRGSDDRALCCPVHCWMANNSLDLQ